MVETPQKLGGMRKMAENILKKDLVAEVAEDLGFTKKDTEAVVDGFISAIVDHLVAQDTVQLTGFGKFVVAESAARNGRNPQTGEELFIPAKLRPSFKAGKGLKDAVAGNAE